MNVGNYRGIYDKTLVIGPIYRGIYGTSLVITNRGILGYINGNVRGVYLRAVCHWGTTSNEGQMSKVSQSTLVTATYL